MDYYYSLLENYEQLKKRKFKLSSRSITEAERQRDIDRSKASIEKGGDTIIGRYGDSGRPITIFKEGQPRTDSDTANKLLSSMGPDNVANLPTLAKGTSSDSPASIPYKKEDGEAGTIQVYMSKPPKKEGGKEQDQEPEDELLDPEQIVEDSPENEEIIQSKLQQIVDQLTGLLDAEMLSDEEYTTLWGQATGAKGTRISDEDIAAEGIPMATMAPYDPEADEEERLAQLKAVEKTLDAQSKFLDVYKKFKEGKKGLNEDDAAFLRGSLVITPNGLSMGDMYRQYRRKANKENDAYLKMAEELNESLKKRAEEWKNLDDDRENPFKEISRKEIPSGQGGDVRANRGIIAEKLEITNLAITKMEEAEECLSAGRERGENPKSSTQMKECKDNLAALEQEVYDTYQKALKPYQDANGDWKPGAAEQMMELFSRGNQTRLGNHLSTPENMQDAGYIDGLKEILRDDYGMSEGVAEKLIELGGQKPGVGLAVVIQATRKFSKDLYPTGEVMPDGIAQTGQEGGQELGEKADMVAQYDGECDKKITEAWNNKLSESQQTHYKKTQDALDKCGGDAAKGIGIGALSTQETYPKDHPTKAGKQYCAVRQELKVVDDSGKKVSFGEGTGERSSKICSKKERETDSKGKVTKTQEYLKLHNARMECFGVSTETACDFQEKLDDRPTVKASRLLLDISQGQALEKDDQGNPVVPNAKESFLETWWRSKGYASDDTGKIPSPDDAERYQEALRAIGDPTKATAAQKKHLKSISGEIEQLELNKMVNGPNVTGEALEYMCNRLSLTGGSAQETVKVGRKLEDRIQTVGLNNAEVYGTIAGLKDKSLKMVQSGNTYNIVDSKTGEKRFAVSMERGRMRMVSAKAVANIISSPKLAKEKAEASLNKEDLFMNFLKGQQSLLEKLIDQTT